MRRSTRTSQVRNRTGGSGEPIIQTSRLEIGPTICASVKARVFPQRRSAPAVNPFVMIGAGRTTAYELHLEGRFFDEREQVAFDGDLRSRGRATPVFGGIGATDRLSQRNHLTGGLRYTQAKAHTGGDFRNLGSIDLSGLGILVGYSYIR